MIPRYFYFAYDVWYIIFASLTHVINAYNKNELCLLLITDDHFTICHYFLIKINLKMNFASYGHFVSYEKYNIIFYNTYL